MKKDFGDSDLGQALGCASIIIAFGLFFFLLGLGSSLNQ